MAAFIASPLTTSENEQTRKRQQLDVAYFFNVCRLQFLHRLLSQDFTHILLPPFGFSVQTIIQARAMLVILHICFPTGVTLDYVSICEISCMWDRNLELLVQAAGVWSPVLDESSRVHVRRIMLFRLKLSLDLCSPTFPKS